MLEEQLEEVEALEEIFEEGELVVHSWEAPISVSIKVVDEETEDVGRVECVLRAELPEEYPSVVPKVTIEGDDIPDAVKAHIVEQLMEEAEGLIDVGMLYSLADALRENMREWGVPVQATAAEREEAARRAAMSAWELAQEDGSMDRERVKPKAAEASASSGSGSGSGGGKKARRGGHLSKADKKKLVTRQRKELVRGHDWVDVVAHLRKTGGKAR